MMLSYLGRGIAHERMGMPCQDALGCRRGANGSVTAVLSDGAGSARYAAEAARATVDAVLDYFAQMSLADFVSLPLRQQREELLGVCVSRLREEQARAGERELGHFSATLLFAVVSDEQLLLGHLGDGMIAVLDRRGNTLLYSEPEQCAGDRHATYFTISSNATSHLRLHLFDRSREEADLFVMTSDGACEMLSNRGGNDPVATVRELWEFASSGALNSSADLADVLDQMAEVAIERMDDWSLLLWHASGRPEELPVPEPPRSMLQEEKRKYLRRTSSTGELRKGEQDDE